MLATAVRISDAGIAVNFLIYGDMGDKRTDASERLGFA